MRRILATDLDGTLFYPKRRISMICKKNLRLIKQHIANGGKVIIVSGRNETYATKVMKKIGTDLDVVCCNGAFVKAGNDILNQETIPANISNQIFDEMKKNYKHVVISVMGKGGRMVIHLYNMAKGLSEIYKFAYRFQGVYGEKFTTSFEDLMEIINNGEVYKMLFFFGLGKKGAKRALEAETIIKKCSNEIETAVTNNAIEITFKGCTKSKGIQLILDHYGYTEDDIVCIGDGRNDIPMLSKYPHTFAMSHAVKEVRESAKAVVKHFYDIKPYLVKEI